ncbi:hypothetical protein K502DRAFT_158272 [Neoconidiobolus thromboides FSU 785]|nr:hypothetical protein K502DRAFT_158272 [Neoconidiobolus thromboides FSU 785]
MVLKFCQLSDVLLEDIFKLLHPEELFDLCFLSKELFDIVNRVIKYHSIYSVYFQVGFTKYQKYQYKFILENGILMNHIYVKDDTIRFLDSCPNLTSIHASIDTVDINKLEIELPKLRKLSIDSSNFKESLNVFNSYLNQVVVFECIGLNISIEEVVKELNPDKLIALKVYSIGGIDIKGLDTIKTKFINLRRLNLKSDEHIEINNQINPSINFVSNLKIEIRGYLGNDFNIKYFGDLNKIKGIKLMNYNSLYFNNNNKHNNMVLIENSNVVGLGYFNPRNPINYDLLKIPTLKDVYFWDFTKETLNLIPLLTSTQIINFGSIRLDLEKLFAKLDLTRNDFYDEKFKLLQSSLIKEIKINCLYSTFEAFAFFLSLFPNLKVIKAEALYFINRDTGLDYVHTAPLIFIAPFSCYKDTDLSILSEYVPSLDWIKSE